MLAITSAICLVFFRPPFFLNQLVLSALVQRLAVLY